MKEIGLGRLQLVGQSAEGKLYYTKVRSIWNEPTWEEASAKLAEPEMSVTVPEGVTVHYFAATDERGLMVSSEYLLID